VTASNVSAPSCLVAEDVTECGIVDDSADILVCCVITNPAGGLGAQTSDLVSGTATAEL